MIKSAKPRVDKPKASTGLAECQQASSVSVPGLCSWRRVRAGGMRQALGFPAWRLRTRSWGPGSSMSCWGSRRGLDEPGGGLLLLGTAAIDGQAREARLAETWPPPSLHLPPAKPEVLRSCVGSRERNLKGLGTGTFLGPL